MVNDHFQFVVHRRLLYLLPQSAGHALARLDISAYSRDPRPLLSLNQSIYNTISQVFLKTNDDEVSRHTLTGSTYSRYS